MVYYRASKAGVERAPAHSRADSERLPTSIFDIRSKITFLRKSGFSLNDDDWFSFKFLMIGHPSLLLSLTILSLTHI
jgi:hypothetical protein